MVKLFAYFLSFLCLCPSLALADGGSSYFKKSYQDSRRQFLEGFEALHAKNPKALWQALKIPSAIDEDLFIDVVYFPPPSGHKDRLLILSSGLHGIEAFTGSALQSYFLQENFFDRRDENLGILLIHAVNPYGFKHERRVSENNVDLNRNFDVNPDLFKIKNEGYDKVSDLLNPTEPATATTWSRLFFYSRALWAIVENSMETLRRAVLRGQYEHPKDLYFGGQNFEPQRDLLQKVFLDFGAGYQQTLLIDLHTGYGQRGHLHLFMDSGPEEEVDYLKKIFAGYELDAAQKKDFYETTGGFVRFAALLLHEKSHFAGMTFEFGTLDSQKTLGSLDSIYRMSLENQDFQYGDRSPEDKKKIQTLFREMFYPSDSRWRKSVLQQFRQVLSQALKNQATP